MTDQNRISAEHVEEAKTEYKDQLGRWRTLWVVTFTVLVASLIIGALTVNLLLQASKVRNEELNNIESALLAIERNQAGIDELVSFVRDVKEAQETGGARSVDLQIFIDLLCASDDPVRQQACEQI